MTHIYIHKYDRSCGRNWGFTIVQADGQRIVDCHTDTPNSVYDRKRTTLDRALALAGIYYGQGYMLTDGDKPARRVVDTRW